MSVILHYANQEVKVVSRAKSDGISCDAAEGRRAGWRVEVEYFDFNPLISKCNFVNDLMGLREHVEKHYPLDKNGNFRQGYLFPFNPDGLSVIKAASKSGWPAWGSTAG